MPGKRKVALEILRIFWKNNALTARIFEENFRKAFEKGDPSVRSMEQPPCWKDFFSQPFAEGAFFSPNYELQPLIPWLLSLRNAAGSPLKLLFIAHAPGGMPWIWRLLPSLLRPGDRMVAPSEHAARIIRWFMPELAPAIRVIPHPIPLPEHLSNSPSWGKKKEHFLVLGRLRREKCLHQLIQGYALFREGSRKESPPLVIAGPLVEEERGTTLSYYLALRQRVRRLGLEGKVLFPGAVTGSAKEELFRNARGVCNLSLSLEESFGKTPAEALVRGIPLLATRWSAFPEVVGTRGILLSPRWEGAEEIPSLDSWKIAEALEVLGDFPRKIFPEGEDFPWNSEKVRLRYRKMLEEALEEKVSPLAESLRNRGILECTAPLNVLSEEKLFEYHRRDCSRRLRRMAGESTPGYSEAEEIQGILEVGLRKTLGRLFAHQPVEDMGPRAFTESESPLEKDLFPGEHPYLWGGLQEDALRSSRIACALVLGERGNAVEARKILDSLGEVQSLSSLEGYVRCVVGLLEKDFESVWNIWKERKDSWQEREEGAGWLSLGFRMAPWMEGEIMREILRIGEQWLRTFPDAPESARVALQGAQAALEGGSAFREEARKYIEHARLLTENSSLVERLELDLLGYLS